MGKKKGDNANSLVNNEAMITLLQVFCGNCMFKYADDELFDVNL